jgi:sec-independent protein translocase protein TatA
MFGLGVPELLIIALIILLIFGAKRIPGIGEGLGKTVREIRNIKKEFKDGKASQSKKKETAEDAQDSPSEEMSVEGKVAQTIENKLKQKVIEQVPGIGQAKKIKDKAEQIKKLVS